MLRLMLVLPMLALSSPSFAGWQGTEWGMNRSEVEAEIGVKFGDAFSIDYTGLNMGFTAMFGIWPDNRGLSSVSLKPKDAGDCRFIPSLLTAIYGPTESTAGKDLWYDEVNDNTVEYVESPADSACSIEYRPLNRPNQAGGL